MSDGDDSDGDMPSFSLRRALEAPITERSPKRTVIDDAPPDSAESIVQARLALLGYFERALRHPDAEPGESVCLGVDGAMFVFKRDPGDGALLCHRRVPIVGADGCVAVRPVPLPQMHAALVHEEEALGRVFRLEAAAMHCSSAMSLVDMEQLYDALALSAPDRAHADAPLIFTRQGAEDGPDAHPLVRALAAADHPRSHVRATAFHTSDWARHLYTALWLEMKTLQL